jgi:hypothetical protein
MPPMGILLQENLEVVYLKGSRQGQKDRRSYDVIFNEMTEDGRQILFEKLHSQYQAKEILLRCRCNLNGIIDMVPVNGGNSYYIRTLQGKKSLHIEGCNFEGGHQSNYHANWQEDESTGKIRVRFRDSFVVEKNEPKPAPNTEEDGEAGERPPRERKNTYNRITLYAFFMRLLLDAWNVKMRTHVKALNEGKTATYPDLAGLYESVESHWADKIVFGKDHELKRVLYAGRGDISKAAYSVKKQYNLCLMTLLLFEDVRAASETHHIVTGTHLSSNSRFEILCEKYKWEDALHSLSGIGGPYLIGGWVTDTGYGKPAEFRSMSLIPISSHGVVIDSSYEREFYNECHRQQRHIIRPYNLKYYPTWSGMLPDGLFLDTSPETIVEIFGMSENQDEYHERKDQKIAHFSQLKESLKKPFSFWFWEAYNGGGMPSLPL